MSIVSAAVGVSNPSPTTKFINHFHTISSSFPALK
jgi:hypothetical protein